MAKHGLVLAGGGARGAYEIGVLNYLMTEASPALKELARFKVLCGTSVGALNITALAATAHQPSVGISQLVERWKSLTLEQLLPLSFSDLMAIPGWLAGRNKREALFAGGPIKQVINSSVKWENIRNNLENGIIDALSVTCTQVSTGHAVVFYEERQLTPRPWSRDPHVRAVPTYIGQAHARASASIPLVFPPVEVEGALYVDGGLRQNTPLSPALRLGAESVLVVGVGHGRERRRHQDFQDREDAVFRPFYLLGKVLDALMIDRIDYDLIRLNHFNMLLQDGEEAFGKRFVERLNDIHSRTRHANYRVIPNMVLKPTRDIGTLAADFIRGGAFQGDRSLTSRMIRTMARSEASSEADLASYLLFDGGFASRLIELGMEDAHARRDALIEFFGVTEQVSAQARASM